MSAAFEQTQRSKLREARGASLANLRGGRAPVSAQISRAHQSDPRLAHDFAAVPVRPTLQRQPAPPTAPAASGACDIHFRVGTTEPVKVQERDVCVAQIRRYLAGGGHRTVTLHGYASEEGPLALNQRLGHERAETIRRQLVRSGVPENAVVAIGHGPDTTFPTLAANRRVEVSLSEEITFDPEEIRVPRTRCGPDVTAQVRGSAQRAARFVGLGHRGAPQ